LKRRELVDLEERIERVEERLERQKGIKTRRGQIVDFTGVKTVLRGILWSMLNLSEILLKLR
jgi:hypothetical protein